MYVGRRFWCVLAHIILYFYRYWYQVRCSQKMTRITLHINYNSQCNIRSGVLDELFMSRIFSKDTNHCLHCSLFAIYIAKILQNYKNASFDAFINTYDIITNRKIWYILFTNTDDFSILCKFILWLNQIHRYWKIYTFFIIL